MFAVIKTGGRQFRVVPDDVLEIGKIAGDVGTIVQLGEVLVVGGDTPVLGAPFVSGASVAAEVLDHKRGAKVIAFKKRRRKNSRRKKGHRQDLTTVRILEVLASGQSPSTGPATRPTMARKSALCSTGSRARLPPSPPTARSTATMSTPMSSCRRARPRCRARRPRPRPPGATAISGSSPSTGAWPGRKRRGTPSAPGPRPLSAGSSA